MAVDYRFKKGVDVPQWQWLSPHPQGVSNPGSANVYDGTRYIYWAINSSQGTAGTSGGTTELWRYDTWSNGWQRLAGLNSGNQGMDLEYDSVRKVIYYSQGAPGTAVQCFNLNLTSITIANVAIAAWTLGTLAVLPATPGAASSFTMPDDLASNGVAIDGPDSILAGSTATSLVTAGDSFGPGMVGLYVRFTSGALSGLRRQITAVPNNTTLTVLTFGSAPAAGDLFVVELPEGTATSGLTTTLTDTTQAWTTNLYANSDVQIISGTGSGQRRRIASHTATVLTLSAAVTGNARTGPFSVAPDATSVYRIVPSSDFLYWQNGGATTLYRLDVVQTTGAAWSAALAAVPAATGGGGNTLYPGLYDPFTILCVRGANTTSLYRYLIGTNAWQTLTTVWGPTETVTTGASVAMLTGRRRLFIQFQGSQRCYVHDLTTGLLEPAGFMPYIAPSASDGKRARSVRSSSGVEWMYLLRAGGQEFFRVPVEWI